MKIVRFFGSAVKLLKSFLVQVAFWAINSNLKSSLDCITLEATASTQTVRKAEQQTRTNGLNY